ncbi:MAG: FG-GAP-like repeat-containing protein, partial [Flavobacteriales bacterium]|nr:FG-GAP-like repeat-containing protein [Flavobacteriales bacterium]
MRYIYTLAILFLFNTTFAQFQENILKDSMVNFIGEIELVDLDLDGEKDIVYSYFRDIYYLKNSNGSFQDIHVLNRAGNSIDNFEVYDDDNDGDLDFFMVRYLQNKVEVLRNAGALSFSYAASINATNWYEIDQVIMNDINKDGTVEAIISSTYDNKTAIYTRNANGTYSAPVNSYQSGTTEWEVCNLDMDTFPDFRSTNRWLESNIVGGYTFDWDPLYIDHVGLGDVDGDGDDDLIGLDSDNRLLYFQNDYPNSSSFLSSVMIDSLTATELAVSDISGDGLADIVLLSFSESKILWLQNLGSGQFSAP